MPEGVFCLLVVPFMKTYLAVSGQRCVKLCNNEVAVCLIRCHKDVLCQTLTNGFCHLERSNAALILTDTAVWKCYFYHSNSNMFKKSRKDTNLFSFVQISSQFLLFLAADSCHYVVFYRIVDAEKCKFACAVFCNCCCGYRIICGVAANSGK